MALAALDDAAFGAYLREVSDAQERAQKAVLRRTIRAHTKDSAPARPQRGLTFAISGTRPKNGVEGRNSEIGRPRRHQVAIVSVKSIWGPRHAPGYAASDGT